MILFTRGYQVPGSNACMREDARIHMGLINLSCFTVFWCGGPLPAKSHKENRWSVYSGFSLHSGSATNQKK